MEKEVKDKVRESGQLVADNEGDLFIDTVVIENKLPPKFDDSKPFPKHPVRFKLPRAVYRPSEKGNIYIVRTALIKRIKKFLKENDQGENLATLVAVSGFGGVGKTFLINYIINDLKDTEDNKVLAWFNAESKDLLENDYRDFASLHLKPGLVPDEISVTPKASIEIIIEKIKAYFRAVKNWVCVYDNAPCYQSAATENEYNLIGYLPEGDGRLLATSRHVEWPNPIEVDLMELETEAIPLIRLITGHDNYEEMKELAILLGRLPLAIAQAATYIKKTKTTFAEYFKRYKVESEKIDLLQYGRLPISHVHHPVLFSWKVNIESIQKNPIMYDIICFSAYLSPSGIPTSLLKKLLKVKLGKLSNSKFDEAIVELSDRHLLSINEDKKGHISLHRIFQEVVRLNLSYVIDEEETLSKSLNIPRKYIYVIIDVLTKSVHYDRYEAGVKHEHMKLLQQIKSVWRFGKDILEIDSKIDSITLLVRCAEYSWYEQGDYNGANDLLDDIIEALESIKKEKNIPNKNMMQVNYLLLKAKRSKGVVLSNICEFEAGRKTLLEVETLEKEFKVHEKKVLIETLLFLSYNAYRSGNYVARRNYFQSVLAMQSESDDASFDTIFLQALVGLANTHSDLGDIDKSENTFEKARKIVKRLESDNKTHLEVAGYYAIYADLLGKIGRYDEEVKNYEKAIELNKVHCSSGNHPLILITTAKLAKAYTHIENHQKAKDTIKNVITIKKILYGKNNNDPYIATTYLMLSEAYRFMGSYSVALDYCKLVTEIHTTLYSKEYSHVEDLRLLNEYTVITKMTKKTEEFRFFSEKRDDLINSLIEKNYIEKNPSNIQL